MALRANSEFIFFSCLLFCSACSTSNKSTGNPYLNNYGQTQTVYAVHAGVACTNVLASNVGIYILQQGGNAIDAAIAMQLALAVVYPEAGNIGGGGFMVMRLKDGTTKALDYRETAPALAYRNMYLDKLGQVQDSASLQGHLAAGVPGTIAGIFESMPYAKLPFKSLIQPAIDLAERGYLMYPGTISDIGHAESRINTRLSAFDSSHHWKDGDTMRQPELAETLKRIRDHGRKDFYEGKTAHLIVDEMKRGGGIMTMSDLKSYHAKWRAPLNFDYRGYQIISMPLPSSGGILLDQMLKMIEPYPMTEYGFGSVRAVSLMIEVERRAFKDRSQYLGDGDFSKIPVGQLLDSTYIKNQMKDFVIGIAGKSTPIGAGYIIPESKETTHLSVVDKEGNAVSVTTTLNTQFGCGIIVGGAGFYLNNEMNDFSLKPGNVSSSGGVGGQNNSIEPGKRMLSSMSPTIVVKEGKLFMVLGTPGGTTIITSVFQALVDVIDFNMSATEVVKSAKFHHEWLPDVVSIGGFPNDTLVALIKMGYKLEGGGFSDLEIIKKNPDNGNLEIVSAHGSAQGY